MSEIYFKYKFSKILYVTRKIKNKFDNFLKFFLAFCGITILIIFILKINPLINFEFLNFFNIKILLLSIIIDCYAIYLFLKDNDTFNKIPNKFKKINVFNFCDKNLKSIIDETIIESQKLRLEKIYPQILLLTLTQNKDIQKIYIRLGIEFNKLISKISKFLLTLKRTDKPSQEFSVDFLKIMIETFKKLLIKRKYHLIKPIDVFETLIKLDSITKEIFFDIGFSMDDVLNVIEWIKFEEKLIKRYHYFRKLAKFKPKTIMNKSFTALRTPLLDQFSQDLTLFAKFGYINPIIGYEKEVQDIFDILELHQKGVVILGEKGVGKKDIINQIAIKMTEEIVPEVLQDKRLVSLSIANIIGSSGNLEKAHSIFHKILQEVAKSKNIVLVIKDIHNLVWENYNVDLSDILSDYISTYKILVLGTSDFKNYEKYILNSSLSSFLESIIIKEPSYNKTLKILISKLPQIEAQNRVFFTYKAIQKAVELSEKFIHYKKLPQKAIDILYEISSKVKRTKGENNLVKTKDIKNYFAEKFEVPTKELEKTEKEKLLNLENEIYKKYVNQEQAVKSLANALRRARTALREQGKPIANFLFIGPTGVGKTYLAKQLSEIYFGKKDIIRLDMSEYQGNDSISKLIGGFKEEGILIKAIKRNPYSVLLLDEFEKANPEILNLFLQVMDEGRLTSGLGETYDFSNLIIIATSNAGTKFIQDSLKKSLSLEKIKQKLKQEILLSYFRPELLNRFDDIIVFKPLGIKEMFKITELQLINLKKMLLEKGIFFEWTTKAIEEISKKGFDPLYGARPLKRLIQEKIMNKIAEMLLKDKFKRRDKLILKSLNNFEIKRKTFY